MQNTLHFEMNATMQMKLCNELTFLCENRFCLIQI